MKQISLLLQLPTKRLNVNSYVDSSALAPYTHLPIYLFRQCSLFSARILAEFHGFVFVILHDMYVLRFAAMQAETKESHLHQRSPRLWKGEHLLHHRQHPLC